MEQSKDKKLGKCPKCQKWLPLNCFHKDLSKYGGHITYCKECRKKIIQTPHYKYLEMIRKTEWKKSKDRRYKSYRGVAKRRKYEFKLTKEEFLSFWQKLCYYCGNKIKTIGLDRIDNSKGYIVGNVVSCCQRCNRMKGTSSQKEFIEYCKKIAKNF